MIRLICVALLLSGPSVYGGCNAPIVVADTAENYGGVLVIDVLANDRDPDGDELTVTVSGSCAGAQIQVRGGLVEVAPANHVPKSCTFGYRATDSTGLFRDGQIHLNAVILGPIFADGFEGGSTVAWDLVCTSACLPDPES